MQVSSVTGGWLVGLEEVVCLVCVVNQTRRMNENYRLDAVLIDHHHPLNHCALAEASLEFVSSCPNRFHDSGIRDSLSAPVSGGRTGGCQTGPYCEGFCGGRSESAAADRDRHGLCHL